MKNLHRTICIVTLLSVAGTAFAAPLESSRGQKLFRYSRTTERERPQLNEETRRLISEYRRNPSEENKAALRKQIEKNYDAVIARKKAKLEELKKTARHDFKIREMEKIVDEVVQDRERRIEQSMRRFTDPRLRPGSRRNTGGFLPVIGAAHNVFIAYTPVTNEEYAKFIKATGHKAPPNWVNGKYPAGKAKHPVVNVSVSDAEAYCQYLTEQSSDAIYRLPTEDEWEFAAGHMPKDTDFNNGEAKNTLPVDAYRKTLSACGAIDMWGNAWEWTSTSPDKKNHIVKGGSFKSSRMHCRTEHRTEKRNQYSGAEDVGFRVIRESK